jgi:anti-anti-sigma factor
MTTISPDACVHRDQILVLLRGELDITTAPTALAALTAAAIRGESIVADLAELDFLDCSAVRLLMLARTVARQSGGDVALTHAHGGVLRLLTILGYADGMLAEPENKKRDSTRPALRPVATLLTASGARLRRATTRHGRKPYLADAAGGLALKRG